MKPKHIKTFFTLLAGVAAMMITSCSKKDDPLKAKADFSFIVNNTVPPAKVEFSNHSVNATEYLWDFGDNTSSKEASPEHSYTKGGTFTVKLSATGNGGTDQKEYQLTVGAKALVVRKITLDSTVLIPNPVNIYATVAYDGGTYTLPDFEHPVSGTPIYPAAFWSGQRFYPIPLQAQVTVQVFYKITNDPKIYPIGDAVLNTFNFKPSEYITGSKPFPLSIPLVNADSRGKNKVTFDVAWQ